MGEVYVALRMLAEVLRRRQPVIATIDTTTFNFVCFLFLHRAQLKERDVMWIVERRQWL